MARRTGRGPSSTRCRQQSSAGIVILPHACEVSCRVRAGRCCPAGSAEVLCFLGFTPSHGEPWQFGSPAPARRKRCAGAGLGVGMEL